MQLFDRRLQIIIGEEGTQGREVSGLRVEFEVEKEKDTDANLARLSIFNLGREIFEEIMRVGYKLVIRAGYNENLFGLFFGDITNVIQRKEETDTIIEIEARDGHRKINTTNLSIGYGQEISIKTIIEDIISVLGIPLGNPLTGINKTFQNGYSFIGKAKDALTEICAFVDRKWQVNNEQIFILEEDLPVEEIGLFITPSTGLIQSPEPIQEEENEGKNRYNIKTLLMPQLSPGVKFRVEAKELKADILVDKVVHSGDNADGEFVSEIEGTVL